MVKSVLGVNHQGLRDWLWQRLTSLVIAIYSLGLLFYFLFHPQITYLDWHALYVHTSLKIFTLVFVLAVVFHAWYGIWTIITDYVKPASVRLILHTLVFLTLLVCFIWAILILWGVS